ncbi:MAG: hypothetical protein KKC68_00910, partial [Candidatus Thermoplasmatota archaeon]|nr:hypothetical protein [Candidatus Thermoplasmatota archaeon]
TTHHTLRAHLLICLLVSTSAFPLLITQPTASAQTTGETTFYIHQYDYLGFYGEIDQNFPTKTNVSALPPKILSEDFINWGTIWLALLTLGSYRNDSSYNYDDLLGQLFNTLRIRESYTYQGEDSISIDGTAYFTLYFDTLKNRIDKYKDQIEIKLLHEGRTIANKTVTLDSKLTDGIIKKEFKKIVPLTNLSFTLKPGDTIGVSLEFVFSKKILYNIINASQASGPFRDFLKPIQTRFVNWLANSTRPKLQTVGEALQLFSNLSSELNISREDLAQLFNEALPIHVYFLYDSVNYPSSFTIPSQLNDQDIHTFYLSGSQLTETKPTGTAKTFIKLKNTAQWQSDPLERNKIIIPTNATLSLFISHFSLFKKTIQATLLADNTTIATAQTKLKHMSLSEYITGPRTPITLTFTGTQKEITANQQLTLKITITNNLNLLPPRLFYNTLKNPSSLQITFKETDNIQLTHTANPASEQIVPGDKITYSLNITSKYADTISLSTTKTEEIGSWELTTTPTTLTIEAGETKQATVTAKSTNTTKNSYGNTLAFKITAKGKTGIDTTSALAEVSENAIKYAVTIESYTESKTIKKGTNGTFYFIIKNRNTGAIDDTDTYTISATSKNNWELQYIDTFRGLKRNTSTKPNDIPVIVHVPKNTSFKSDTITFTVTSEGSNGKTKATVNVTVEVLQLSLFETIYEFFESASKSIGLDGALGENAPLGLAAILLVIIMFIIIILTLFLTQKLFSVTIDDPIQEIDPTDQAVFTLSVTNRSKKAQTFTISTPPSNPHIQWNTQIDPEQLTIPGQTTKLIRVTVSPTTAVQPNDWVEMPLTIKHARRKKIIKLSTMVSILEGKPIIQIIDAFTWPKEFIKGDRIITSFKVHNKGSLSAPDITILFYLNGKQKNKVRLTIPSNGYADIKIPWIAVKGKNKVLIKAVEKKR